MIYLFLTFLILFTAFMCRCVNLNPLNNRKVFYAVIFFALFCVMGFRGSDVGVDTSNYIKIFSNISMKSCKQIFSSGFYVESMEIGYALMIKVFSLLFGGDYEGYIFFQITESAAFCFLSCIFFYKYSDEKNDLMAVSVFMGLGIYATSFNIVRQMLALSIALQSYDFIRKNKKIKAAVVILFSMTIHCISFVLGAVLVIEYLSDNGFESHKLNSDSKKVKLLKLVSALIIALFWCFNYILQLVFKIFPHFINYSDNHKTIQSAGMVMIVWLIIIVLSFYVIYNKKIKNIDIKKYAIYCLLYVVLNLIGLSFNYIERIGLEFSYFVPLLFANSKEIIHNKNIQVIFNFFAIVCFLIYFLISVMKSEQYKYSLCL